VAFRATHRFFKPAWSGEQNRARFGTAADEPGHTHDYRCAVTVTGTMDPETDTIVDLTVLDEILAAEVVNRLDGKQINLDLPEFAYGKTLPSCEALARFFFGRLAARLPRGIGLVRVRVAEDATLHADCIPDD